MSYNSTTLTKIPYILALLIPLGFTLNANADKAQPLCAETTKNIFESTNNLKKVGITEATALNMVAENAGGEPAQSIMSSMVSVLYSAAPNTSDVEVALMMHQDCIQTLSNMGVK